MRVDKLNRMIGAQDRVLSGELVQVVVIQRDAQTVECVHQCFNHRGTAEEMWKPATTTSG